MQEPKRPISRPRRDRQHQLTGLRFLLVDTEDPDFDAPVRPALATTRKLLRYCQMGVPSASISVLLHAASPPPRIAFVPDRRTARDCIGDLAAMPRRYAA